jgi:eukaryotic-like serine/threonine-protein kinase
MIGKTIGKYRIVGQVGRGGAGIVYRAIDETLNRDVAIKTLNPDLANSEVMKRFRAEATILAKLNHPHIATIYELFRSDTDLLMVMEFVRGETLDKLSARLGPIPPDRAAYLIDRILSGLEHAHRAGVVHRDMKPANVMVTEGGGVKIMDFGIARVRGAEQMTIEGRLMGTPAYMPPEQVLGQEVDGRADLYSVGVVFYRLLAGVLPFHADTALAMMQRQILEPPEPVRVHCPDLPDWCDAIVRRALEKAADDRFQTAEEFREELRRATGVLVTADFAGSFPIEAPTGDTIDLAQLDPAATIPDSARRPPRSWRNALMWGNVALTVLAIAGALGYTASERREREEAPAASPAREPGVAPATAAAAADPTVTDAALQADPPDALEAEIPSTAERRAVRVKQPPASEPVEAPDREPAPAAARIAARPAHVPEAPLIFETRTLVGTKKPREHDAQLVLADGRITVTPELESEYPFYSIPYDRVISITYSRGRDPMWKSPEGPLPVTRGGGTLGRIGIMVSRDWIALRTSTQDQFVSMRFDDMLVRRVLLALEERTGRKPELIAEPKDPD